MAMSKITIFPIEAWEKGWEKQLPKHFRSFWKKPTASSEIVRRLCFCTHSSLSERSKSICEWMATAWCPKKHSDRATCDRNKYNRMTNMCSSPYVSHVFPKSMKTNYSNSIYFTNGLGMACHTPHFFHMTTPLTSEHHPCLMDIFATLLSGSGVALTTPKRHPKVGYQWGTNGVPMGPGRLLWYVASHLANFPVQPWRPNSSKDKQCSKVASGNDCYSSLLKMVIEKLIYPWIIHELSMIYPWFIHDLSMIYPWIAWWIFPYVAVYQAGYPSNFYRIQGSRPRWWAPTPPAQDTSSIRPQNGQVIWGRDEDFFTSGKTN